MIYLHILAPLVLYTHMSVPRAGKNPSIGINNCLLILFRAAFVHGSCMLLLLHIASQYSLQAALV